MTDEKKDTKPTDAPTVEQSQPVDAPRHEEDGYDDFHSNLTEDAASYDVEETNAKEASE